MGDRGLLVELGDGISRQINQKVRALFIGLKDHDLGGIQEMVPGYRSLAVVYDPLASSLDSLKSQIMDIWSTVDDARLPDPRIVEIPVAYGDEFGPDFVSFVPDNHFELRDFDTVGIDPKCKRRR